MLIQPRKIVLAGCMFLLLSVGELVWGQVDTPLQQEQKQPFLLPYSPINQQEFPGAAGNLSGANTKKDKNIDNIPHKVITPQDKKSPASPLGFQQESTDQRAGSGLGSKASGLGWQEYHQSKGAGGSFLDGYLLKSLHEKENVRKKLSHDEASEENNAKKKKR